MIKPDRIIEGKQIFAIVFKTVYKDLFMNFIKGSYSLMRVIGVIKTDSSLTLYWLSMTFIEPGTYLYGRPRH